MSSSLSSPRPASPRRPTFLNAGSIALAVGAVLLSGGCSDAPRSDAAQNAAPAGTTAAPSASPSSAPTASASKPAPAAPASAAPANAAKAGPATTARQRTRAATAASSATPAAPRPPRPPRRQAAASTQAPAAPATPAAAAPAGARNAPPNWSDIETQLEPWEPARLAAFKARTAQRDTAVAAWHDSAQGKELKTLSAELDAAEASKDTAKIDALKPKIAELNRALWQLRSSERSAIFATISPAQQCQWIGLELWSRQARALRGAKLTPEQIAKAQEICRGLAAPLVERGLLKSDPYLTGMDMQNASSAATPKIEADVLDDTQRKYLSDLRATRAARSASGAPAATPAAP